jgi:antitoxin MazE
MYQGENLQEGGSYSVFGRCQGKQAFIFAPIRYTFNLLYIQSFKEQIMQVAKWGNSLAVRLPVVLVQALDLKEGEEIALHVIGSRTFEVSKKPEAHALLARLRQFRGRLPADFHFDRLEANSKDEIK